MANSSFFKSSGTSSTTESTIETQVNNASTSATNAASSATSAASSASAASTSETNASSSATSASSSASTAQTHANTATTKASEAATSATSASTSASTATTKASTATTQASNASASASSASTSATNASNSATAAATSATNASNSATAAASSATSAANSASSIGDLDSLSDVVITSVSNDEVLSYDSSTSKFINQTPAEAGILTANQTITLSGDASGSGTTAITVTVADDSHNHIIGNVDGLQTALDAKSTASKTETLTNKTFDVEGTGNSVSNIDVANLKAGVLDTDISSVSGSDDTLASAKAIKTYVDAQVSGLVDSSPAALDTLNELAAAINDDANFSTTVTNSIATKLNSSAVSSFGLTLVDDADAAAARTTLGAAPTSHTQASSTITDFATAASAEAIPFAIALG
jgi:hypothetical protein